MSVELELVSIMMMADSMSVRVQMEQFVLAVVVMGLSDVLVCLHTFLTMYILTFSKF